MKPASTIVKVLFILCCMAALGGCNNSGGGSENKGHGHSHD